MPGSHREADREPRSDLLPGVKEAGRCTGISRTPPKSPERTDEPDGIDQHIRQEHANQAPADCALDMSQLQHHSPPGGAARSVLVPRTRRYPIIQNPPTVAGKVATLAAVDSPGTSPATARAT